MNPYHDRALCRIEHRETQDEILRCLTPEQRAVVAFIADGWTIGEVAELLNVQRSTVSMRLRFARRRIRQKCPHLAGALDGRVWTGGKR